MPRLRKPKLPKKQKLSKTKKLPGFESEEPFSSHPADLNCRPADYESAALPAELEWRSENKDSKRTNSCQDLLTSFAFFSMIGLQKFF